MSKTVKIRNVSPLGYVNLPHIGRVGEAPQYAFCATCAVEPDPDHEHDLVTPEAAEAGSGCLVPGEVVEVPAEYAEELLAMVGIFEAAGDGLEELDVDALKAYAADHGIDLGNATTKAKILAAIRKG